MELPRFVIAYMHSQMVDSAFVDSLTNLTLTRHKSGTLGGVISQETGVGICEGRNLLAKRFMDTGIEWMLMLDSDMAFHTDLFDRLMETATEKTIATGLYFAWNRHKRDVKPTIYDADMKVIESWESGQPFEVGACGAGCMLIHKSVFDKFDAPWFEQAPDGNYLEDVGFCMNAASAGIKIICDPAIALGHCKAFIVGQGDWFAYKEIKNSQGTCTILPVGA